MVVFLVLLIIALILILVIIGLVFYAVKKIKRKVNRVSRQLFGTNPTNVVRKIKRAQAEFAATPKSLSAATDIYLPRIIEEFPEFNYDEMRRRAENVLLSYLQCISDCDVKDLEDANDELENQLEHYIRNMIANNVREHFSNYRIHKTEISAYHRENGRCSVVFQSAIQYHHYVTNRQGRCVSGSESAIEQSRYNIELVYIQDRDYIEENYNAGEALNCPNCCAPVKNIGAKMCEYCMSPIVEFNIRVWQFCSIKES